MLDRELTQHGLQVGLPPENLGGAGRVGLPAQRTIIIIITRAGTPVAAMAEQMA